MNRQAQKLNFNGIKWFLTNNNETCFCVLELTGQLCFAIVSDAKTRFFIYFVNFEIRFYNCNI